MEEQFSAILLAGGKSSRMGTDKSALELNGKTLLERQAEKLFAAGAKEVLLCGTSAVDMPHVVPIRDILPNRGPLGGIYSGLLAAKYSRAIVLSVDVPLLPSHVLRTLCEVHRNGMTLLRHQNQIEPLIGMYDKQLANSIFPLIQTNSAPVKALLRTCIWQAVDYIGDEAMLCNCNTPDDWEKIRQLATQNHIL